MDAPTHLRLFQQTYRTLANDRAAFDRLRNSDSAFVAEIESLYTHFVGPLTRYCGNCIHDAFMRLMILKKTDMKESKFRLLAGTLLHDPVNQDINYMLTPARLAAAGDDLALRHLAHNPGAKKYFAQVPENLDKLIADYLKREKAAREEETRIPEEADDEHASSDTADDSAQPRQEEAETGSREKTTEPESAKKK